jgi:hypothetical protein
MLQVEFNPKDQSQPNEEIEFQYEFEFDGEDSVDEHLQIPLFDRDTLLACERRESQAV